MRIAVLSDIHSNYVALELVVDDAKKRGVDDYWFLGDAIGYGWQPVETLGMLEEIIPAENWVIGNHDILYANILHPGGFRPEAQIMMNHNRSLIEAKKKSLARFVKFMDERFSTIHQPPKQKYIDGVIYFLSHTGFDWEKYDYYFFDSLLPGDNDKNKALFSEISANNVLARSWQIWKNMDSKPRVLFFGHTHSPVVAHQDLESNKITSLKVRSGIVDLKKNCKNSQMIVINPGSVGFPKDRWHYPSYVILDTRKKQVEFCRVMEYDYNEFDKGYSVVKKNIAEYIKDGLWKPAESNNHNGTAFVKYEITESVAKKTLFKIEQEILNAPHPRNDYLRPDFRSFYASDSEIDLS